MALANVAWILAANGHRVLVADWDLEAPDLYKFFQPFVDASIGNAPGIVDIIRRYEWSAVEAGIPPYDLESESADSRQAALQTVAALVNEHIERIRHHVLSLNWQFPRGGAVDYLSAGKQVNGDYQTILSALNWDNFYDNLYGAQFFDALRIYFKREWDYVLIDSRAGLSDIADICTIHLPDVVVNCFTLSPPAVDGAARIAQMIQNHTHRDIRVLPVPTRIDDSEKGKSGTSLTSAARKFPELPEGMEEEERRDYWASVAVPYRRAYSYEEMLAVFGDSPGSRTSLLYSFERLTGYITNGAVTGLPPMDEKLRLKTKLLVTESGHGA